MMGRGGWAFAAFLSAVLLVGALLAKPGDRPAIYGLEANSLLAAESLFFDRDLEFASEDLERFEARHGHVPAGVHLERTETGWMLAQNWFWGTLAAPWVRLAPHRGAAIFQSLLLLAALWVAARRLVWRLGGEASWVVPIAGFLSLLPILVFVAHSGVLWFAATVFALALVSSDDLPAVSQLPELHQEAAAAPARLATGLAAGALAALPACMHPIYLVVPMVVALSARNSGSRRRMLAVVAGSLALLVGLGVVRTQNSLPFSPWERDVVEFDLSAGFPPITEGSGRDAGELAAGRLSIGDVASRFDAIAWSGLYSLFGRSVGGLIYFLPALALLTGWARGRRSHLVFGSLIGLTLLVVFLPFDFAGYVATPGNWALLPFYALLLFLPTRVPNRAVLALTAIVSAAAVWPLWIDPYGVRPNAGRTTRFLAPGFDRYLPVETTLRDVSREAVGGSKVIRVEPVSLSLRVIGGRDLEWDRGLGGATLLISAPEGVERIFLDFDKNGGATLELDGGEIVETLFRPNGRIAVVVQLSDARVHSTAASSEPTNFYTLRFKMPEAAAEVIRFRCSADTVGG